MKEIQITKFSEFIEFLDGDPHLLFRGVCNKAHQLIPAIARNWDGSLNDLKYVEKYSINQLKLRAINMVDFRPSNDFEWLIVAQHYGVPTRLLDWTSNPLVALFFACNSDYANDGAVYNFIGPKFLDVDQVTDIFEIEQDYYFQPRHLFPRLTAQSSFFTISANPLRPLEETYILYEFQGRAVERIVKIVIEAKAKEAIFHRLSKFGIGSASLFPGLDGLCRELSWEVLRLQEGTLSLARFIRENPEFLKNLHTETD